MPDLTIEQAIALLRQQGGYDWLIDGAEAWSASNVADRLCESGIEVSSDTVVRWFKTLPTYQDFGKLGIYASRSVLLVYFASKIRGAQAPGTSNTSGAGM